MWWFFEIIVQLGLDQRDMLEDYWLTLDKHSTAFYCNILKQDRWYRVLRFLHFSDNKNEHDKTDVNWTDCGKWQLFWQAEWFIAKYYSLKEHLAVDEIIALFKDTVIFKQNIPKKHKQFIILWKYSAYHSDFQMIRVTVLWQVHFQMISSASEVQYLKVAVHARDKFVENYFCWIDVILICFNFDLFG